MIYKAATCKCSWIPCCESRLNSVLSAMPIGSQIQAWRLSQGLSLQYLATAAQIREAVLEEIEAETTDPSSAILESIAAAMNIPVAWLFSHPDAFHLLFHDTDEAECRIPDGPDPVTQRILTGSRLDRSLYVMLTALIQSGEPKLLRAAEVSLKSLIKQSKQSSVPWLNRPSGHFEPPGD